MNGSGNGFRNSSGNGSAKGKGNGRGNGCRTIFQAFKLSSFQSINPSPNRYLATARDRDGLDLA